ncbi:oligosaccharide flippase family protein [Reichenbachiella agarivorans]|uniref:Oligosaccharide flippase family protein n=1 Tax=Reichenbachiella agarivorans TaxID=2979464 RepID=A0ABY6CQY5_9BACT|nr:oligosaccharide flippase family protein [Reichenbachiella agarivorans]UXP32936.1 oligosaccharide flippase family protein [Reichenbachiella agarivorans]
MSSLKKIAHGVIRSGLYTYIIFVLRFLVTLVLSRFLSPSEYAVIIVLQIFTGIILVFQYAGIPSIIVKQQNNDDTFNNTWHTMSLFIGIVQFGIIALIAFPAAMFYSEIPLFIPLLLSSVNFIITSLGLVPQAILRKELKFDQLGIYQLYSFIPSALLAILMAYTGFSFWSIICQEILLNLIMTCILLFKTRVKLLPFRTISIRENYKKQKKTLSNLFSFSIINYFSRNSDNIIIGKIYSQMELGLYNRAYSLLYMIIQLIPAIINKVAFPNFSKSNDIYSIRSNIHRLQVLVVAICFPLSIPFILFGREVALFLWGAEWSEVGIYLPYFGVLMLSQVQTFFVVEFLILFKMQKLITPLGVTIVILNIGSVIIGTFFSVEIIAFLLTLSNTLILWPLIIYFIYYKVFKLKPFSILFDYFTMVVTCVSMTFSILFNYDTLLYSSLIGLGTSLIFSNRINLVSLLRYLTITNK